MRCSAKANGKIANFDKVFSFLHLGRIDINVGAECFRELALIQKRCNLWLCLVVSKVNNFVKKSRKN